MEREEEEGEGVVPASPRAAAPVLPAPLAKTAAPARTAATSRGMALPPPWEPPLPTILSTPSILRLRFGGPGLRKKDCRNPAEKLLKACLNSNEVVTWMNEDAQEESHGHDGGMSSGSGDDEVILLTPAQ